MPSYLVCELNSTSKIMRTFFFLHRFAKVGHQSFFLAMASQALNHSSSTSSQAHRQLGTDCEGCSGRGNQQVAVSWLKGDSVLRLEAVLARSAPDRLVQQQKLHSTPPVSNTWHPSGQPVCHTCPSCPVPIWPVFTTALLNSCLISGAFLLGALVPYLEPFLPTKELVVCVFNNTTIWASDARHQVISGKVATYPGIFNKYFLNE